MIDRKTNITQADKYRYIVRIKNKHIGVYGSLTEACIARDKERATMDFNIKSNRIINGFTWRFEQALFNCGLNLSEISKKSKVSRSIIWSYRFAGVMPNSYNLARLASVMNVSTDWLLGLRSE